MRGVLTYLPWEANSPFISVAVAQIFWGTSFRTTIRTLYNIKSELTNIILKAIY